MRRFAAAAAVLAVSALGRAAAQTAPPAQGQPPRAFTVVNATIHPASGPDIPNGRIVVRDGKIAEVGPGAGAAGDGPVVDVEGRHVYPSLLPPVTVLGLAEIGAVKSTIDTSEIGEVNPAARASLAMNYDSELLPVARSGGVLIAGVSPTGSVVSGTAAVMRLQGWTREDGALRDPAAITVFWPDLEIDRSPDASRPVEKQKKERDERVRKLKDAFRDARAYASALAAEGRPGVPRHDVDGRMEALVPAVEGKIPVIVRANRLAQIRDALAWARDEKLLLAIWGGADAWRAADELAKARVPVIVDSPVDLPQRDDEPYDTQYALAGRLDAAGVRVLFNEGGSPDGAANVRNLPLYVGTAIAFGFPREKALPAVTLEPARLLGVAERVGSLDPGKDATFIVTDGDLFDVRSRVVAAYLDGKPLDLSDKQKRLYERYRNRPRPQQPVSSKQ
jgi:imidazolonepropionase-like amidohydrolase